MKRVTGPYSGLGDHKAMGAQRRLHPVLEQETSGLRPMPNLLAKDKVGCLGQQEGRTPVLNLSAPRVPAAGEDGALPSSLP